MTIGFFIISHPLTNMGILDKIHHAIFRGENDQENPVFDLKELQENLRKRKEKEAEKNPVNQMSIEKSPKIEGGNYKIVRVVDCAPDPLIAFGRAQKIEGGTVKVCNPMLLGVKMFLAEIPYIIKADYDLDKNNCLQFSKDVQAVATKNGIRCGLVIISFYESPTGHAIVAFETDYGLKFFEPQSADEEDVIVGRQYSGTLSGIASDDIIIKIEIYWNDGTNSVVE
jgi:hypothetical protein